MVANPAPRWRGLTGMQNPLHGSGLSRWHTTIAARQAAHTRHPSKDTAKLVPPSGGPYSGAMEPVDTIVQARWVVPVQPRDQVLHEHSVVIRDGRILDLLPSDRCAERYRGEHRVSLPHQVLIPGLVNAHTHSAMSLLRGYADDLPLTTWLQDHIWPAESRWVSEEFVRDGARLAVAEMLLGGTTCFNDMYFFPDAVAEVCVEAGIRGVLGLIVLDFPTIWAGNAQEYLDRGAEVHDRFRQESLIHCAFAPHAPYTVSDEPLARVRTLADELDLPVHMHVHETAREVRDSMAAHGERPLARLDRLGLCTNRLMAVHMTQVTPAEMALLAQQGVHVVHCPESNLKLASGYCPVAGLLEAGVNVALGTDGPASNNDLCMFGEMRTASLLAKGVAESAAAVPAGAALEMATLGGARALGLERHIGSIEIGKAADLVAVDLQNPATQPVYNPIAQLVYAAASRQVCAVWVAGRMVVDQGRVLHLDLHEHYAAAERWRQRIGT